MAITWEWECGAHYNSDSPLYEFGGGNYNAIVGSSTVVKTGVMCFRGRAVGDYGKKSVTASRQKRIGLFAQFDGLPSAPYRIVSVRDASNNFLVEVRLVNATGNLSLVVAGTEQDTYASLAVDAWYHIGLDVKVDSSAGWAVVYVDGIEAMRFEGDTGNADITQVYFWSAPTGTFGATDYLYLDDIYCEDTAGEAGPAIVPIRSFYEMVLSGDGTYSQFTGSDGNQVSNYALVDENPPNEDTDYVLATAADVIDSYATTNYAIPAGMTVNAVHAFVIAKKTGTAATQVKPFLREDSTDWAGTAQNCNSDYTLHIERRTTDPAGAAWDQTALNGLEAGVKSAGAYA